MYRPTDVVEQQLQISSLLKYAIKFGYAVILIQICGLVSGAKCTIVHLTTFLDVLSRPCIAPDCPAFLIYFYRAVLPRQVVRLSVCPSVCL